MKKDLFYFLRLSVLVTLVSFAMHANAQQRATLNLELPSDKDLIASVSLESGDYKTALKDKEKASEQIASNNSFLWKSELSEYTESIELLTDEFFYEFTDDNPLAWEVKGKSSKLDPSQGYHSDTGYALMLDAKSLPEGEHGYLRQVVDLTRDGKTVSTGDELEALIHYFTVVEPQGEGSIRLSSKWLDATDKEITTEEEVILLNNEELWFSFNNAWKELRFRTVAPAGATQFVFEITVHHGAVMRFDDFSLLRLAAIDKTPFSTILPQQLTITTKTNNPLEKSFIVQTRHLMNEENLSIRNSANSIVTLESTSLPMGNAVQGITYLINPLNKKVYQETISAPNGSTEEARLNLRVNAIDKDMPPTITLADNQTTIPSMTAGINETSEQTLTFDVTGVIGDVNLGIQQEAQGAFRVSTSLFWYSAASDKVIPNSVKLTYAPKTGEEHKARLYLSTIAADTVFYELSGTVIRAEDRWIENFSADREMDPRFVGELWDNYHLFDTGYWHLDGQWNAHQDVGIASQGTLSCDEWFYNGIENIRVYPKEAAGDICVEISIDGGGHWALLDAAVDGVFAVGSKRPTLFRLCNSSETTLMISGVELVQTKEGQREKFTDIDQVIVSNEDKPLALLNETFTSRHTRGLQIEGWQNLIISGERPFRGWDKKNAQTGEIEENVAQISFFQYQIEDRRPHESLLLTPALSFKTAASKILTWRLRYELPTEDGNESFNMYIIEKGENGKSQLTRLDLEKLLLVPMEEGSWYEYYADLSDIDGLEIDDIFYVAFSYGSSVGGNESSLSIMLDDVTFGRNDLPTITVDKELLSFSFIPGFEADPQLLGVTASNNDQPILAEVSPKSAAKLFPISDNTLPAEGGSLSVGFKSDNQKNEAAMLLIQTRGAASKIVKLLAMKSTGVKVAQTTESFKVYPTETSGILNVDGEYVSYYVFSTNGALLTYGSATKSIDVSKLSCGHYLLQLVTVDGKNKTFRFTRQ